MFDLTSTQIPTTLDRASRIRLRFSRMSCCAFVEVLLCLLEFLRVSCSCQPPPHHCLQASFFTILEDFLAAFSRLLFNELDFF
ncbi:hypothetical protein TNCT_663451 [Trichonephila clavata]|uniref:Uncharacterized protein n=1 Tax=Trichonephila clavata TaxID=2740835 RepID=A0A8X6IWZ8_TRICU|nr:hypothetical protein TNCT_663451 [Trichonephila clavata]